MKNKIYIEMGNFLKQYEIIKDDAFLLLLRKDLIRIFLNLSNKYNLVLLTNYDLHKIRKWLKRYHFDKFFSEYHNYSLEKALAENYSIEYYIIDINLQEL